MEGLEGLTIKEVEKILGITEEMDDYPPEYCPDSESWLSFNYPEADFEKAHKEADKALAWLEKYLQTTKPSTASKPLPQQN